MLPQKLRGYFLLLASCVFYMYFVPVYILVLLAAIVIDYFAALKIAEYHTPAEDLGHQTLSSRNLKKRLLWLSIVATCSLLFFFKYINFAIENLNSFKNLSFLSPVLTPFFSNILHRDRSQDFALINIILPVGLSFHTFQSLGYVIEVYRKNIEPERNFFRYALFVMYYPQLVAGPIERPQSLLPQLQKFKNFDAANVRAGLQLMLWGLFKKVVVADRISYLIAPMFLHPEGSSSMILFLAACLFTIQVYGDFSGYSDIALGASRAMNIELTQNFVTPFFSKTFSEVWTRWHVSLNRWMHDYVFVPLGGYRSKYGTRNLMISFAVSGFWHGARWTYMLWGLANGFFVVVEHRVRRFLRKRSVANIELPAFLDRIEFSLRSVWIFFAISFTEIFFRSTDLKKAWIHITQIFRFQGRMDFIFLSPFESILCFASVAMMLLIDRGIDKSEFSRWVSSKKTYWRWSIYFVLIGSLLLFGVMGNEKYVYFQF